MSLKNIILSKKQTGEQSVPTMFVIHFDEVESRQNKSMGIEIRIVAE